MRINLFGGPCSGKSTLAPKIFSDLNIQGYSVELVREFIKNWAYQNKVPKSFDQIFIFSQQLYSEDLIHQSGIKHLVTDSPMAMQPFYAKVYNFPCWKELLKIVFEYERVHPSINIFLNNEGLEYKQEGRYENKDEAKERSKDMKSFLTENNISFEEFKTLDYCSILDYIKSSIQNCYIKSSIQNRNN